MKRQLAVVTICGAMALAAQACATKGFVREQVGSAEAKLGQRVETQETRLKETADRTQANAQALEATGQRLSALDARVGEVGAQAGEARKGVDAVAEGLRETDARWSQRFANRNAFSTLDTRSIYFDFGQASVRDEGITELDEVARALKANPNAVVELHGWADPRGSERYNYRLTRERVDAVTRYLVERHGIELRRIHAVGMGKVKLAARQAGRDAFAKSRRVEIRLLAPQS